MWLASHCSSTSKSSKFASYKSMLFPISIQHWRQSCLYYRWVVRVFYNIFNYCRWKFRMKGKFHLHLDLIYPKNDQILFWNHVGRLVWAIKSIDVIICNILIKRQQKTCMHFKNCKWLMILSKFYLQWCIELLNYFWIATTKCTRLIETIILFKCSYAFVQILNNNIIGIECIFLSIAWLFSFNHLHGHEKAHVIVNFMFLRKHIEIIKFMSNNFLNYTHTHLWATWTH